MSIKPRKPRVVLVTRKTPLELLIERHGTPGQAKFYLQTRGESLDYYRWLHERFETAFSEVQSGIPSDQHRTRVDRDDLDRFLFGPDDVIVVVGQDGLIPNVAKYLSGQIVIGINPDPENYDGVLCPHAPNQFSEILGWMQARNDPAYHVQARVMAIAVREDGQQLRALNEIFIGHRTHQSARYRIRVSRREERQSSSGVICATGTGGTGWARSIAVQRHLEASIPTPEDVKLTWFVREPFPSVATGVNLNFGQFGPDEQLEIVSEMAEDGVVFADGIEPDRLEFISGQNLTIRVDEQRLHLVVPRKRNKLHRKEKSVQPHTDKMAPARR